MCRSLMCVFVLLCVRACACACWCLLQVTVSPRRLRLRSSQWQRPGGTPQPWPQPATAKAPGWAKRSPAPTAAAASPAVRAATLFASADSWAGLLHRLVQVIGTLLGLDALSELRLRGGVVWGLGVGFDFDCHEELLFVTAAGAAPGGAWATRRPSCLGRARSRSNRHHRSRGGSRSRTSRPPPPRAHAHRGRRAAAALVAAALDRRGRIGAAVRCSGWPWSVGRPGSRRTRASSAAGRSSSGGGKASAAA
jgi:hypothetical protein